MEIHMIDQMTLLEKLDRLGGICRRFGLTQLPPAGKNLLKPLFGNRLSVHVEGFDITASLEQRHYLRALRRGEIEALMARLFADVIRPGMVVLDIGAFVGWYTLLAARGVGARGRVYAFEPDPRNFNLLHENLRLNQLDSRVIGLPKAVSDETGIQSFFLHGGDQSRSSLIPSGGGHESTKVGTIVLDDFLDRGIKVDVVKIDIEGGEVNALRGMQETLSRARRGVKLFVECNRASLQLAGESPQSLLAELRRRDFSIYMIDETHRGLKPVDSRIETAKYVNLYCIRE
jgi:FkbM family methyltransferase